MLYSKGNPRCLNTRLSPSSTTSWMLMSEWAQNSLSRRSCAGVKRNTFCRILSSAAGAGGAADAAADALPTKLERGGWFLHEGDPLNFRQYPGAGIAGFLGGGGGAVELDNRLTARQGAGKRAPVADDDRAHFAPSAKRVDRLGHFWRA